MIAITERQEYPAVLLPGERIKSSRQRHQRRNTNLEGENQFKKWKTIWLATLEWTGTSYQYNQTRLTVSARHTKGLRKNALSDALILPVSRPKITSGWRRTVLNSISKKNKTLSRPWAWRWWNGWCRRPNSVSSAEPFGSPALLHM